MNEDKQLTAQELDSMFANTRGSEPYFEASDFTDTVINRLPTNIDRKLWAKTLLADVLALLIAAIVVLFILPEGSLTNLYNAVASSVVVISSSTIIGIAIGLSITSISAWWFVEGKR